MLWYINNVQILISRLHKPEDAWAPSYPSSQRKFAQKSALFLSICLTRKHMFFPRKSLSLKCITWSRFLTLFFERMSVGGEVKSFPIIKTCRSEETSLTIFHFYQVRYFEQSSRADKFSVPLTSTGALCLKPYIFFWNEVRISVQLSLHPFSCSTCQTETQRHSLALWLQHSPSSEKTRTQFLC